MAADGRDSAAGLDKIIDQALDTKARIKVFGRDDIMAHSVPTALLASASTKFAEACSGNVDSITLQESIAAFRVMLGWLLRRVVAERNGDTLAEAWILAGRFELPVLQNAIMRALVLRW
ncbi:hypothetical protein LTR95_004443 [Oleoguttula sp. CCFEE 5521]